MSTSKVMGDLDGVEDTATSQDARTFGAIAAGVAAAVVLAAGATHGFGKDDETMVGTVHIALGHALPAVAFAPVVGWLAALWVLRRERGDGRGTLTFALAVVGLVLWASVTAGFALGAYAAYHVNHATGIAMMKTSSGLNGAFFAAGLVTFVTGVAAFLIGGARQRLVPGFAVALIVIGGLGSFFAGPVGDALMAAGLIWAALRLRL